MLEENNGGDPQNGQESGNESQYNPADLNEANTIIASLVKRVDERKQELRDLRETTTKLSEQMQTLQDAQKKRLEQSGNYEEIAKQRAAEIEALSPYKDRASALESVIRENNEKLIQGIPENMRGIVPTDYPPEKLNVWLTNNTAMLTKPPAPDYDAGAGGQAPSQSGKLTAEQKSMARRFGLTDEEYLAEIQKQE